MKHFFFGTYFILLVAVFLSSWGVELIATHYMNKRYEQTVLDLNKELSRGTFTLLEKEFEAVSILDFSEVAERLQPSFGYPLEIHHMNDFILEEPQKTNFIENEIIVQQDGDYHFKRIGDTDFAVSMGPFRDFEIKPLETTGFMAIGAVFFGLFLFFWAVYFWSKLHKISEAVSQFGQGDFTARVVLSRFSSLSSIGKTFNDMAEQIERLLSSHKQLVNAVSHELRTPISRLKFGLESLKQEKGESDNKQISGMRKDIDELEDLVSELLSYSRLERVATQMDVQSSPILPWIRNYLKVADEIFDKPIAFSWHDINEMTEIKFNGHHLERAIHNILQNGCRYAKSQLGVKLWSDAENVFLEFGDDGHGIKDSDREHVFKPFVRLDSSRNRDLGGYGLGLSIVYEIIKAHGGVVRVDVSELGGAAITICLPLVTT